LQKESLDSSRVEAARIGAFFPFDDELVQFAQSPSRPVGDGDLIVAKHRSPVFGFHERECPDPLWQLLQRDAIYRGINLVLKVKNPELIKVAKDGVTRALRSKTHPVLLDLGVMLAEVFPPFFHFDQNAGLPY
jgi:hypothetical protein